MTSVPRRPLRGLFIAGTDTGVGKTVIAAALLRHARDLGRPLIPFKPVETGADPEPEDAMRLRRAARSSLDLPSVCPFPFSLPAAPQAAAAAAGLTLSLDAILDHANRLAGPERNGLVVESAGGLLVPYGPDFTGADLARALGLPILLVARTALGTINHVALSLNELQRRGLPLAGLILVDTQPDRRPHEGTNQELIAQLTGVHPLAIFPFVPDPTPDLLASVLARVMAPGDLQRLLDRATGDPPAS